MRTLPTASFPISTKTYNVDVPVPKIDGQTLPMGFRPVYQTYVDSVIEHLGGKSFRETAEEELLARFLKTVRPSRWSKVKPELKKDKITFPDIVYWDSIHLEYHGEYEFSYDCRNKVNIFCEGIAYGSDNLINGSTGTVIGLDERNVDITQWYSLTTDNARQIKFYKNGRIDYGSRTVQLPKTVTDGSVWTKSRSMKIDS